MTLHYCDRCHGDVPPMRDLMAQGSPDGPARFLLPVWRGSVVVAGESIGEILTVRRDFGEMLLCVPCQDELRSFLSG